MTSGKLRELDERIAELFRDGSPISTPSEPPQATSVDQQIIDAAVFEAVHGSAPDIAGKGVANPLAVIMSGVMMLNHLHEEPIAARIKSGYDRLLAEADPSKLTRDLGGTAGTDQFADALIATMQKQ